jgi:hypothetical protein
VIAAGCALATLALIICAAYAIRVPPGHARPGCLGRALAIRATRTLLRAAIAVLGIAAVRTAVVRARWAWRCRGGPPRNDGDPLQEWERWELSAILRGRKKTARPERSRT